MGHSMCCAPPSAARLSLLLLALSLSLSLSPAHALVPAEVVSKSNFTDCPHNDSSLKLWSEPDTWRVPIANASEAANNGNLTDVIIVGNSSRVLLDVSRVSAGGIIIEDGSALVLDDRDYNISVGYIRILPGGSLIGGGPSCPLTASINITLVGSRSQDPDSAGFDPVGGDSFGVKTLAVAANGTLALFGVAPSLAWTRLADTARAGASKLTVMDSVNWTVGSTVLVAGSAYHTELTGAGSHEHEELIVAAVDTVERTLDGAVRNVTELTLSAPLRFQHLGEGHTRAEVAVLSRNIRVIGSEDPTRFGFHLIAMAVAAVRISGVEFVRGGQLGLLGRYPVHFHMSGDLSATDSFVRGCSFRSSLQRALTLHGTSGVDVADNVAYDAIGHMYLLEDGSENNNTLRHNLGVLARPMLRDASSPPGLLDGIPGTIFPLRATDDQPAVFQLLSPGNSFVDNAAVGGTHGFWLTFPTRPAGPSFWEYLNDTSTCPRYQTLGAFEGNTAHGAVRNGVLLGQHQRLSQEIEQNVRYSPRRGPYPYKKGSFPPVFSVDQLEPLTATLSRVTTWANGAYGAILEAENVVLDQFVSVGNRFGFGVLPFDTAIVNSLVVGSLPALPSLAAALQGSRALNITTGLGQTGQSSDAVSQAGIVLFPGHGAQGLHNISFENLTGPDSAAIAVSEQLVPSRAFIAADSLSFTNVDSKFFLPRYPSADRYDVGSAVSLLDLEGAIDSFSVNGSVARSRPSWIVSNDTAALSPLRANHSACSEVRDSAASAHAVCDALQVPSVVTLQLTNLFPEATDYSLGLLESFDTLLTVYPFSRTGNASSTPSVPLRGVDSLDRVNGTRTVFRAAVWTHSGVVLRFRSAHATPPAFALSLSGAAPGDWVVVGIPITAPHLDPCTVFRISSPAAGDFVCHHSLEGLAAPHTVAYDEEHTMLFVRVDQREENQRTLRAANASFAFYNDSSAINTVTVINIEGVGREMADDVDTQDWLPTAAMLETAIPERFFEAQLNESVNGSANGSGPSNTSQLLVRAAFAYDLISDSLSFAVYHNAQQAGVAIASLALRVGNSSETIALLSNDTAFSAVPIRNFRLRLSEDLPLNSSDSNRTRLDRSLEAADLLQNASLVVELANGTANSTLEAPLLLLPNTTAPPLPVIPVNPPPSATATGTAGPGPISSTGTAQTAPSSTGSGEGPSSSLSASATAAPTPSASASASATGSASESSSPSATAAESSSASASATGTGTESSSPSATGSESSSVSATGSESSSVSATGSESSSASASASASATGPAESSSGVPSVLPTVLPTAVPTAVSISGQQSPSATGTGPIALPASAGTSRARSLWRRWREALGRA